MKACSGARGFEDTGLEDTFDGDYGRVLDRAYRKSVEVLADPRVSSWNPLMTWLRNIEAIKASKQFRCGWGGGHKPLVFWKSVIEMASSKVAWPPVCQ